MLGGLDVVLVLACDVVDDSTTSVLPSVVDVVVDMVVVVVDPSVVVGADDVDVAVVTAAVVVVVPTVDVDPVVPSPNAFSVGFSHSVVVLLTVVTPGVTDVDDTWPRSLLPLNVASVVVVMVNTGPSVALAQHDPT